MALFTSSNVKSVVITATAIGLGSVLGTVFSNVLLKGKNNA